MINTIEDKKTGHFINSLVLNVVLKELPLKQRREFYKLLKDRQYDKAQVFINNNIPDFENKLFNKIRNILNYE